MRQRDHLLPLLAFVAISLGGLAGIWLETPIHGRFMAAALATWGLLSLPVGFLVGHYCALGDDPATKAR